MRESDINAFYADPEKLESDKYLVLKYYLETVINPREAIAQLCQEMSTAQWSRVGVDEDFRPKYGAKIVDLEILDKPTKPSIPFLANLLKKEFNRIYAVNAVIYYPYENFGKKIPNLLTAVCGEGVFHAPNICAIRLMDIDFPSSFLADFQGPQFGVQGIRDILKVYDRPIFLGVIKPNVGLPPEPFSEIAYEAWLGGLDIAKDDEQLSDVNWSSVRERSYRLGVLRKRAESETGEKKIYLTNITDEVDRLIELHDIAVTNGANAVMVNGMTTGFSAIRMLRKHARVPIFSHLDFMAPFIQLPYFGVRDLVFTKIQRMAGYDALIYPGFDTRMKATKEDVIANANACLEPMGNLKPILPIPAGSQWAGSLKPIFEMLNTIDFGIVPGRAVFNHPMGPKGGAKSLHQGWEALVRGLPLDDYAKTHEELKVALDSNQHKSS